MNDKDKLNALMMLQHQSGQCAAMACVPNNLGFTWENVDAQMRAYEEKAGIKRRETWDYLLARLEKLEQIEAQ